MSFINPGKFCTRFHSRTWNCPQGKSTQLKFCPLGKFTCNDHTCISIIGRCDGKVDCPRDRADEEECRRFPELTCRKPARAGRILFLTILLFGVFPFGLTNQYATQPILLTSKKHVPEIPGSVTMDSAYPWSKSATGTLIVPTTSPTSATVPVSCGTESIA